MGGALAGSIRSVEDFDFAKVFGGWFGGCGLGDFFGDAAFGEWCFGGWFVGRDHVGGGWRFHGGDGFRESFEILAFAKPGFFDGGAANGDTAPFFVFIASAETIGLEEVSESALTAWGHASAFETGDEGMEGMSGSVVLFDSHEGKRVLQVRGEGIADGVVVELEEETLPVGRV